MLIAPDSSPPWLCTLIHFMPAGFIGRDGEPLIWPPISKLPLLPASTTGGAGWCQQSRCRPRVDHRPQSLRSSACQSCPARSSTATGRCSCHIDRALSVEPRSLPSVPETTLPTLTVSGEPILVPLTKTSAVSSGQLHCRRCESSTSW